MKGKTMGSLELFVIFGEYPGQQQSVWSKSGDQGSDWHFAEVNLISV